MTQPADPTSYAESWMRTHRDLETVLDEALQHPEIAEALDEEGITRVDARLAILENPTVLTRIRAAKDWSSALTTTRSTDDSPVDRSRRLTDAWPSVRIAVAVGMIVAYLVLLQRTWSAMPWGLDLFCFLGLLTTAALAVWLGGEDTTAVVRAVRGARDQRLWRQSVLTDIVLPELRQFIAERRTPNYGTTLAVRGVANLYRDDDEAPLTITASGQRLRRVLERSTSDAIAIAGHRGVGKSTAIRAVARGLFSDPGEPPPLQVVATAPSRYDARDFVLHLHATLCKEVIERVGALLGERATPRHQAFTPPPRPLLLRAVRRFASGALFVAVFVGITYLSWDKPPYGQFLLDLRRLVAQAVTDFPSFRVISQEDLRIQVALFFLLIPCIGLAIDVLAVVLRVLASLLTTLTRRMRGPELAELLVLRAAARDQLHRVRFLQTHTSGWSGKIGIPLGNDAGWSRSTQRAEQHLTHPEVVDQFREFARWSARALTGAGAIERMVIAIDELDKIAQPEKAHEFINDVKGIFGVEGCLFLVAVSDDALATFERRGIPVRDAFDSAFTEMVRVDNFTLDESRRWLSRRLIGVPEQFSHLCHCLSGGLPRDLRRSTIDMIDAAREAEHRDLATIVAIMVDRELDRKGHAFAAAARLYDDTAELTGYLTDLLLLPQASGPADLVALAHRLGPPETGSNLGRLRWQSACFVLFCATVKEVFTDDLDRAGLGRGLDLLAAARSRLAIDPQVAWRLVLDVRERYDCLPIPTAVTGEPG